MASCKGCGRSMCSCKLRGGYCTSCLTSRSATESINQTAGQVASTSLCSITGSQLVNWRDKLNSVKSQNKEDLIGITESELDQYIVLVNTALNYPSNYCQFEDQLQPIINLIPSIVNIL